MLNSRDVVLNADGASKKRLSAGPVTYLAWGELDLQVGYREEELSARNEFIEGINLFQESSWPPATANRCWYGDIQEQRDCQPGYARRCLEWRPRDGEMSGKGSAVKMKDC